MKLTFPSFSLLSHQLQCVVERRTGKVQLTLVWNAIGRKAASAELPRFVKHLRDQDPSGTLWHSIWVNFRTGPGNAILSREPRAWYKTWGSDFLTEKVRGADCAS